MLMVGMMVGTTWGGRRRRLHSKEAEASNNTLQTKASKHPCSHSLIKSYKAAKSLQIFCERLLNLALSSEGFPGSTYAWVHMSEMKMILKSKWDFRCKICSTELILSTPIFALVLHQFWSNRWSVGLFLTVQSYIQAAPFPLSSSSQFPAWLQLSLSSFSSPQMIGVVLQGHSTWTRL